MHTALTASLAVFVTASASALLAEPDPVDLIPDRILYGFASENADQEWVTVNDGVMGGKSRGGFAINDGRLRFSGSTNTDGGGFSSIRTRRGNGGETGLDLSGADGLLLRVNGDGRGYIAAIETNINMGSFPVSYWAEFKPTTPGDDETVRIPFDSFRPTFFGEDISDRAPALDPSKVSSIGIYIYDKKDGPFSLDVEWIGTSVARDSSGDPAGENADRSAAGRSGLAAQMSALPVPRRASMLIERAIALGVPRFNEGEQGACADIYEITITSLLSRPDGLPDAAIGALETAFRDGNQAHSQADRAWAYRRGMDRAFAALAPGSE